MVRYLRSMAVVLTLAALGNFAHAADPALPGALEEWRGWVLAGEEYRQCPFLSSRQPGNAASHRCAWPERLDLVVEGRGARFEQVWDVRAEGWIALPGRIEHWPTNVTIDGDAAPIVARDGVPYARLSSGRHRIAGEFVWSSRPEVLPIPRETGLVSLRVDGKEVASPERPDGALFLGAGRRAATADALNVSVYRLLSDEQPVRLHTVLRLDVSGDAREIVLGPVLPAGFLPVSVDSDLPARLDADGRMKIQARSGSWEIALDARGEGVAAQLQRPHASDGWPAEEIWSFAAQDRLRVVDVSGAEGIDAAAANVPGDWSSFPAYRVEKGTEFVVAERTRGAANADENNLSLERRIWFDFDGLGYTSVDSISGSMRTGWRLDMAAPYQLEAARVGGEPQLVTRGAEESLRGVELRHPELHLEATARAPRGALPATGWNERFESVSGTLMLPPGHRLFAALGVDDADTWISQWGLWNVFGVCIVVVLFSWLAGRIAGGVALVALLLTYMEFPALIWLWGVALVAIALARSAPEGRLKSSARVFRSASLLVLGLVLLPFLWGQLRLAFYPQLDAQGAMVAPILTDLIQEEPVAMPSAPPSPATEMELSRDASSAGSMAIEEVAVTSANKVAKYGGDTAARYAEGTLLQTGPGIPGWNYRQHGFSWSGPVEREQEVRFVVLRPFVVSVWRLLGALLIAGGFVWLVAGVAGTRLPRLPERLQPVRLASFAAWPLALLLAASAFAPSAFAASTPDPALLQELQKRLSQPPACAPTCAEVTSARVVARGAQINVELNVSALASLAVPIPDARAGWRIDAVTLDGRPTAVGRERDGGLWVPLTSGARTVRIEASAVGDSLDLAFPLAPRRVTLDVEGWSASGVTDARLVSGSLSLSRAITAGTVATRPSGSEFPPFVRVTRTVLLGLDWTIETTVERVAPESGAFTVAVPLLTGESVTTEDTPQENGAVLAGFSAGEDEVSWRSTLARANSLSFVSAPSASLAEVWQVQAHPQWHVTFDGVPATLPETIESDEWLYEFHPRAGEKLAVTIERPEAVAGRALAIDAVRNNVNVGRRSTDQTLSFDYRSTQGGRQAVKLPADARVSSITADGQPVALRPDAGVLSLPLLPGSHSVEIAWSVPRGVSARTAPDAIDLGVPASNVRTTVTLPADRWALLAFGPGVGPAIVYWGELAMFLLMAFALARLPQSPLKLHEWLLLGVGLSTLSWFVFAMVALWLFAMRWRESWAGTASRWRFNAVQLLLVAFTVFAMGGLLFSGIRDGLLATPDMGITGAGSYSGQFAWFVDRAASALPVPSVVSVPMWVFRALVFAWAIWTALAVVRWLRWAWHAWRQGGVWRSKPELATPASPAA